MIKLVIFDFDGTIVNTKYAYYSSMNRHLNPLGFSRKQIDAAIDLGLNLSETIERFVPFRLYKWWVKRKIVRDVLREAGHIHKCRDVGSIRRIKARRVVISNSFSDFIMPIIRHLKLGKIFSEIHCADEFNDKAEFIKRYLKKRRIKPKECAYVGDRASDVRVARKTGCVSIIVLGKCAWDSRAEVLAAQPDFVVNELREIAEIVRD
jgi:phosphoglycolate phosphatase